MRGYEFSGRLGCARFLVFGVFSSGQMPIVSRYTPQSSAIISLAFYDTKFDGHSLQLNYIIRSLRNGWERKRIIWLLHGLEVDIPPIWEKVHQTDKAAGTPVKREWTRWLTTRSSGFP